MGNKLTLRDFISRSNKIHNHKYDYSLVNYVNSRTKVNIICPIHGEFEQAPNHHMKGIACSKCSNNYITYEDFLLRSYEIHGSSYDYSLVKYNGVRSKIRIVCLVHGEFEQKPCHHMIGAGCPKCKNSKGETIISKFLEESGVIFESQKRFSDCRVIRPLPFDFYLPNLNVCIEYDGRQHYHPVEIFGGINGFELIQKYDKIKTDYCKDNHITLIRIKYNENILQTLKNELVMT